MSEDVNEQAASLPDIKTLTEADEASLKKWSDAAKSLIHENQAIKDACAVILTARQLFDIAVFALCRALDAEKQDPQVKMVLIGSMNQMAKQPFERKVVANRMAEKVFPFVLNELQLEKKADNQICDAQGITIVPEEKR